PTPRSPPGATGARRWAFGRLARGSSCETRFLLARGRLVGFSISLSLLAIIFFSLRAVLDSYIENNTRSTNLRESGAMRFLPVFLDPSAGVIILVGSGDGALAKLRLLRAAGIHVRWFPLDADVAEEVLTLPGAGLVEVGLGDPLAADLN